MAITEAGIYRARPFSPEATLNEASTGTVQAAVEFEILNEGFHGERIWWYGAISEKAAKFTVKALRNCGWTGQKWDEAIALDVNAEVDLDIQEDTYEGKTRLKIAWVNKPGESGGAPTPMDPNKRKAFAARMNGFLLAQGKPGNGGAPKPAQRQAPRQAASAPPPQGATPAALGVDENDIPFALLVTAGLGVLGAVATFGTAFGIA